MAKETEQVDPLVLFIGKVKGYVTENKNQISAVASIVMLLMAGAGYWKYMSVKAQQESLAGFSKALTLISEQLKTEEDQSINYEKALKTFQKVSKKHPGTYPGLASLYYSGKCSLELKSYDAAIEYFDEFLKEAGSSLSYLKVLACEGLGYAYEGKSQYLKAIEWFEKQKEMGAERRAAAALLNIARNYELAGDTEAACKSYHDFKKEFPSSSFMETAEMKMGDICQDVSF